MLADTLPLDLELQKAAHIQNGLDKIEATSLAYDAWQRRWDESIKERQTHSFLPDVRERVNLPLNRDNYVSQMVG